MRKLKLAYKKILFLSGLLFFINGPLFGQQSEIKKVYAAFDQSAMPELFSKIPVGFTFVFKNGSKASTRGFLHGKIRWNNLKVTTRQGSLKDGLLYFSPKKVWNNHHQVTFKIKYGDTLLFCNLKLPYIQKIKLNLYTDSIKKNVPLYLNVEGYFSSGKVLPLDTATLTFSASVGKINGNVLKYSGDSDLKKIAVKTYLQWDSAIRDSVNIPIKTYIKQFTLPSEGELLPR